MSFWELEDGSSVKDVGTDYEMPGGNFVTIPEGSSVKALIEMTGWKKHSDANPAEYVGITWSILEPDELKNRKINQKLWVDDMDPSVTDPDKARKKRDRARRMLAAIDANAGGKLTAKASRPTDEDLQRHLINKIMVISLGVVAYKDRDSGSDRTSNWVRAIANKSKEVHITDAPLPKATDDRRPALSGGGGAAFDDDSEIPF